MCFLVEALTKLIENAKSQAFKLKQTTYTTETPTDAKMLPLISQCIYFLNKSKSKCVCVGLSAHLTFSPAVKLFGLRNQCMFFDETEWKLVTENLENLMNYFHAGDTPWPPMKIGSKTIMFQTVAKNKVIKFQDLGDSELYLGWESLAELRELLPIISYRVDTLASQEFKMFYDSIIEGVAEMPGNFKVNIMNILAPLKELHCENMCSMLEILHFLPEKICVDMEVAKCMV